MTAINYNLLFQGAPYLSHTKLEGLSCSLVVLAH